MSRKSVNLLKKYKNIQGKAVQLRVHVAPVRFFDISSEIALPLPRTQ